MKRFLPVLLFLVSSFVQAQNFPTIDPERIDIVRDEWGVPHIFAPTDAEVAYGLAWANAEDAFKDMQDLLVIGKGRSGRYQGSEGAKSDFFRHVIQAEATVAKQISELPKDYLQYLDGYVQGINAYAKAHPKERVLKKLFPVTVEEVLVSYVVALSFMTDAASAMEQIYGGKLDQEKVALGSNAYAINSQKSADSLTYLCINPHMKMSGTFSFYETHLQSEEGLNMYGAIFQGGTSVFMGNNEHLGWGMTWNHFATGDTYKLKMHPKDKLMYEYDGKWLKLDRKRVWLKVKVAGITFPVRKTSYWSVHGPVLQSTEDKDAFYAFRYPAFMDIKAPMQWYKMNKTKSLDEFKEVLGMMSISLFNIIYADKEDNIFYVSYGQVPYREDSIAKMKVVPGHDSKMVWQRLHKLDELPQEENPDCNYIYNTNNTPFFATCDVNEKLKLELKSYLDERSGQNNRAVVLQAFLDQKERISFEDFQAIKFDNSYHPDSYIVQQLNAFKALDLSENEDLRDIFRLMYSWDYVADSNDAAATVMMVVTDFLFKAKKYSDEQFIMGFSATDEEFIEALKSAKDWLVKHYGKIEVPLGKIFLAEKGDVRFPCPGFPDALAANYAKRVEDKFIAEYGDTYTQFVAFDKSGPKEIRTQLPFGNSNKVGSPYFVSQADLFRKQATKPVSMDKTLIYRQAKQIYHPK
jgi:acyl-homoserine-lactone acylase